MSLKPQEDDNWWTDIHDMQQNNMRLEMQGTQSSAGDLEAVACLIHQRDCLATRFQV